MKVIIDISEESYKYICDNSTEESNMLISDIIRKRESISSELMKSIVNGEVVPDDVTTFQEQLFEARKKAKLWKQMYLELRYKVDKSESWGKLESWGKV